MLSNSVKSATGEAKFCTNSGLISDFAERASKVLCEGAISAATDTVPSKVTVWDNSPTLSAMLTSSVAPAGSLTPVRRLLAKLGADASMEYVPAGSPVTENLPSAPLVTWREAPEDSFRTDTAAVGIAFPDTSTTVPVTVAESPACACNRTKPHRQTASTRVHRFKTAFMSQPLPDGNMSRFRMVSAGVLRFRDNAVKHGLTTQWHKAPPCASARSADVRGALGWTSRRLIPLNASGRRRDGASAVS